uniref:Uncharacterized protein n=1 Tax=Avena sativa TaxID=4498 RepID=A0ACD5U5Z8_AVESA
MSELRKYLMLMAILAATVTYVAGLNPPGGVWLESEDGHLTGNQILVVTHHARYNAFYYSNVIAFMASVVVILLLLLERSVVDQVWWLFSLKMVLVLDLLALMVAYAAGASRGMFATVYASVQVSAVSIYAGTHIIRYFQAGGPHRHRHSAAGKGGKKEQDARMKGLSKILLVFAFFAATVTYTAGLNPPGGFWPDSNDGHRAGDPVLQDFYHWLRFMAFYVCNSAAFAVSLVAVMLLTTMNSDPDPEEDKGHHLPVAYWFVLVALLGLFFAYVFGSSTKTGSTIYVLFLQLPLLVGCILLQFVFQRFCWELVGNCKLFQCVKGYLICCSSKEKLEEVPTPSSPRTKKLKEAHELVLLLATLAATITYQAGMNPPGGVWPDDRDGHKGGHPILLTTHARRYRVFFYCNSVALVASVVVIGMLLSKHLRTSAIHRYHALEAAMILDLLSLVAAYAVGCCRDVGTSLRVIALAAGVLVYILIHMVFFTLEHGEEEDRMMKKKRKLLLLIAILAATITYQAGLTPPGAFWQEGQAAGYAVLATNYPRRYTAFFYCNATSFVSSIAIILLLVNPNLYKFGIKCYVLYVCAVTGLLGLAVWLQNRKPTHGQEEGRPGNTAGEEERVGAAAENQQPNTATSNKEEGQSNEKKDMYTTRKYMVMVAILVAGVTYQAGLTPPGGVWPDSTDGHGAGDPVLRDTNKRRYRFFFDSNSVSFLMSLLVILLLLLDEPLFARKEKELPATQASCGKKKKKDGLLGMGCKELLRVAQPSLLMALLGLLFAYAAGCSREWETSVYVFALAGGVLLYIVIHVLLSYCDKRSPRTDNKTTTTGARSCTDDQCNCKCHGKDAPVTAE